MVDQCLSCFLYQAFGDLEEEKLAIMDRGLLRLSTSGTTSTRSAETCRRRDKSRGEVVPGTGSQRVSSSNCQAHLLKQNYKIGFDKTRQEIDRLLKSGIYLIFTGTTME